MMVLITLVCGEVSNEPACMHDLARAFASRITKYARRLRTTFGHLVFPDTPEWAIIRGFIGYAIRPTHVCMPLSHDPDT